MRFNPHNNKHKEGRHRSDGLGDTAIPAGDGAAPMCVDDNDEHVYNPIATHKVTLSTLPTTPTRKVGVLSTVGARMGWNGMGRKDGVVSTTGIWWS